MQIKKKAPHLLNDNVRLPPMRAPSECVKMPTISRAESGGAAYATRWAAAQFGETTKPLTSGSVYVYAMRVAATPYMCGSHGPSYHMCFLPPYCGRGPGIRAMLSKEGLWRLHPTSKRQRSSSCGIMSSACSRDIVVQKSSRFKPPIKGHAIFK